MSDNHIEHPTPKKYVQIAIVLGILTAIEIALYYTEDIVGIFTDPLLIFLAGQIYEFTEFYHKGFELTTNIFSSSFYVLTGFHGLHVFIGVVLLLALWGIGQRQKGLTLEGGMNLEFVALYWHFVDIVWIVLFTVVYLI